MNSKYLVIFFIGYSLFNNLIPKTLVKGTYEKKHSAINQLSKTIDTLILSENNKFYSLNLGYGKYELSYSFFSTRINLTIKNETSYHSSIIRSWFGIPRIVMLPDIEHNYEKISWDCKIPPSQIERYEERKTENYEDQEERFRSMREHMRKQDSLKWKSKTGKIN